MTLSIYYESDRTHLHGVVLQAQEQLTN